VRDETNSFRWKINLDAIANNYDRLVAWDDTYRTFGGPTCFVRGERSHYIQPEDEEAIRALFPQAEIVTVDGVGHWVHAEAPAQFYQIVHDFLSR
jgi:esterase